MRNNHRLMCIFAHPDDEALGMGGVIAKYCSEGIEVSLLSATRGERGWAGPAEENPGLAALGKMREAELRCAAARLGIRDVSFLDFIDGDLDKANHSEAIDRITSAIRRFRPQVVVTFGPDGAYGHPDHIAISQFTTAALVSSVDPSYTDQNDRKAHRVDKFYYVVDSLDLVNFIESSFGGIHFQVDDMMRSHNGWADWMITTRVDAQNHWKTAWEAICCHETQLAGMSFLREMTDDQHKMAWGIGNFYRAYSFVNGGRKRETDLFEGLR